MQRQLAICALYPYEKPIGAFLFFALSGNKSNNFQVVLQE